MRIRPGGIVRTTDSLHAVRLKAGRLSLAVGILILSGKSFAWLVTGSSAVFADAMESIVNVVAAVMMVFALGLSAKPPDQDHPYGHGKAEFFSAGIEGAAIVAAALAIFAESLRQIARGPELERLDLGLAIVAVCTAGNAILGWHLIRTGERTSSIALVADGRHLMTDVWTSAGVIAGLGLVTVTGWAWIDPVIAIGVSLNVMREGARLLNTAVEGLMDRVEPGMLDDASEALDGIRDAAWIDVHGLRGWRSGARPHFDFHLTVPRYFNVEALHEIHERAESALLGEDDHGGDVVIHFDPCHPGLCRFCAMDDCAIRETPLDTPFPWTRDHMTRNEDPDHGE